MTGTNKSLIEVHGDCPLDLLVVSGEEGLVLGGDYLKDVVRISCLADPPWTIKGKGKELPNPLAKL